MNFLLKYILFLGLTVDQETSTLYWVDSDVHSIQSYSIQDSKVNPILKLPEDSSPSSIALYKNNIYYVDNKMMSIQVANKITGDGNSVFRNITAGNNASKRKYYFKHFQCSINFYVVWLC